MTKDQPNENRRNQPSRQLSPEEALAVQGYEDSMMRKYLTRHVKLVDDEIATLFPSREAKRKFIEEHMRLHHVVLEDTECAPKDDTELTAAEKSHATYKLRKIREHAEHRLHTHRAKKIEEFHGAAGHLPDSERPTTKDYQQVMDNLKQLFAGDDDDDE